MYFPGNNCEEETKDRCIDVGMDAKIVRWNTKENLSDFDGYIIPGGFSFMSFTHFLSCFFGIYSYFAFVPRYISFTNHN